MRVVLDVTRSIVDWLSSYTVTGSSIGRFSSSNNEIKKTRFTVKSNNALTSAWVLLVATHFCLLDLFTTNDLGFIEPMATQ